MAELWMALRLDLLGKNAARKLADPELLDHAFKGCHSDGDGGLGGSGTRVGRS